MNRVFSGESQQKLGMGISGKMADYSANKMTPHSAAN